MKKDTLTIVTNSDKGKEVFGLYKLHTEALLQDALKRLGQAEAYIDELWKV